MPDPYTEAYAPPATTDKSESTTAGNSGAKETGALSTTRFAILKEHARGGLGKVSLAQDLRLNRPVAIKEIRADRVGNVALRERFLVEAQITSRLQHPGIVPIYGLEEDHSGQPYYAMRFLDGKTLAQAIRDLHKASNAPHGVGRQGVDYAVLSFRELLQRLINVCQTIAYAHSKGVLHRDLKPANVMLGDYGETLVLDWGLAKHIGDTEPGLAATASALPAVASEHVTEVGQVLGTPNYMSPEQASGRVVGIETDIYALGAMLYELLTGDPPFANRPAREVIAAVSAGNVPTDLNTGVPRPLAAICRKAMSPRPADRHVTAAALAIDLQQWLADEPVSAWREPWHVRASRWRRRHRTLVTSATAVLFVAATLSFAGLLVVSGLNQRLDAANNDLQGKNTALERSIASEKAATKRVENTLDFFVASLRRPDPAQDGKRLTVYELLGTTVKRLEAEVSLDQQDRRELLYAIGKTYHGLGQFSEASGVFTSVMQLAEVELGPDDRTTQEVRAYLAHSVKEAGQPAVAIPLFQRNLDTDTATLGADHPNTLRCGNNLASAYLDAGRHEEAVKLLERILPAMENQIGATNLDTLTACSNLATTYCALGKYAQAIPLYERALKSRIAQLGAEHPDTLQTIGNLGVAYLTTGRHELAIPLLERNLAGQELKLGEQHPNVMATRNSLAGAYHANKQLDKAIPLFERNLKVIEATLGPTHPNVLTSLNNLAAAYREAGKPDSAVPLLERALQAQEATLGAEHPSSLISRGNLAMAYRDIGKVDLAIELSTRTLKAHEALFGKDHPNTSTSRHNLAYSLHAARRFDEAVPQYEVSLAAFEAKLGYDHASSATVRQHLCEAYQAMGRPELVIPVYERLLKDRESRLGPDNATTLETCRTLGGEQLRAHRWPEAGVFFDRYVAGQRKALAKKPEEFAGTLAALALELLQVGQFVVSEEYLREAHAIRQKTQPDVWTTFNTQSMLGGALLGQHKYAEAEPLLLAGYDGMKQREATIPPQGKLRLSEALDRLIHLYDAFGKPDQAAKWRAKSLPDARVKDGLERDYAWAILLGWPRF